MRKEEEDIRGHVTKISVCQKRTINPLWEEQGIISQWHFVPVKRTAYTCSLCFLTGH